MPDSSDSEYRNVSQSPSLALVRGSLPRALAHQQARDLMHRRQHNLVVHATSDGFANDPAFHWLADLRRGQLRIYGALLRFIDVSVRRGVKKRVLDLIPAWIAEYIAEQYAGGGDDGGSPLRKSA